ncbi:MAG: MBL fold metallo-hydrolase [Acidobacteriia bacterium]|nr:MBL fold metallo-hydrolase [Terriglobia bacterium]
MRFLRGELRITLLDAGSLRLDGGAMFGVVPRPLWERERAPDDRNRIRLGMNLLLIEDGRRRILVDTGAGTKWDDRHRDIYGLEPKTAEEMLAPAGVSPGQIDLVVNTHLHFDHAGGNTERNARGEIVAAFPNARYVVQRGEVETARSANDRTRASYLPENFEPLLAEGRFELVDGHVPIGAGIELWPAPGHTPHMQLPVLVSPEGTVAFLADLVPTASHVPYPYVMGYDLEPLLTLATKRRILPEAAREGWLLVFEHDDEMPWATLVEKDGRLRAQAVDPGA